MERIYIMLSGNFQQGYSVLLNAKQEACYPDRLTYSLACREKLSRSQVKQLKALGVFRLVQPENEEDWEIVAGQAEGESVPVDMPHKEPMPWQASFHVWQGEEYVLRAAPGMVFSRHWDLFLLRALRRCAKEKSVLTGYPPTKKDLYDGFSPVAAQGFDNVGNLCFHPGAPLYHAARPQLAAFLHPDFVFGTVAFFHQTAQNPPGEPENLPWALRGFYAGFSLYTLNHPLVRCVETLPVSPENWLVYPPDEEDTLLSQFENQFGFRTGARRLSAAARLGLYTPDLQFDVHTPVLVKAQEAWRRWKVRKSAINPMCVTAYREIAGPVSLLEEEYESRFHHLARLTQMALVCYAKPPMSGRIRPYFANLYDYQNRYGLPMDVVWQPEEDFNYFSAGKIFYLRRSMNTFPHHSHYCWIDFGYQRWPLYGKSALHWQQVTGDTIHVAKVDGKLDTSFFTVPRELVPFLAEEILAEAEKSHANGRLEADHVLMGRVYARYPRQFTLHDLPSTHELFAKVLLTKEDAFHAHP